MFAIVVAIGLTFWEQCKIGRQGSDYVMNVISNTFDGGGSKGVTMDKFVYCPECGEKVDWDNRFYHRCLLRYLRRLDRKASYLESWLWSQVGKRGVTIQEKAQEEGR